MKKPAIICALVFCAGNAFADDNAVQVSSEPVAVSFDAAVEWPDYSRWQKTISPHWLLHLTYFWQEEKGSNVLMVGQIVEAHGYAKDFNPLLVDEYGIIGYGAIHRRLFSKNSLGDWRPLDWQIKINGQWVSGNPDGPMFTYWYKTDYGYILLFSLTPCDLKKFPIELRVKMIKFENSAPK